MGDSSTGLARETARGFDFSHSTLSESHIGTSGIAHWPVALPLACAVLLIVAIAGATSLLAFHFRDRALTDSERELSNTALILAEHFDRSLQAVELVQKSVIEQIETRSISSKEAYNGQMSTQDVHLLLKQKMSGLPHLESVTLFDSEGNLLNFSRSWPVPALNIAEQDHFKALQSDTTLTTVVGQPVLNRTTGTWTVYFARKITGPRGEFLGLVTGGLDLQYLQRFFSSIALRPDSAISLFRSDGLLLVRYPDVGSLGVSYAQRELFKDVLSHKSSGVIRTISIADGKDRIVGAHRLAHYPLVVAAGSTVAAALASWQEETRILIGSGVLAAFVVMIFTFLAAHRLLQRHKQSERRLWDQKLRLDAALDNMRHGLLMFDVRGRLLVWNERYSQMYRIPSSALKPGCTLTDLLRLRKQAGTFEGDPERYVVKLVAEDGTFEGDPDRKVAELFDGGKVESKVMKLPDGRIISITNQSMPGRGWVSTHEDITERRHAEQERDRNREFLDLLIENVPAPIMVKDSLERRYVLVNRASEVFLGTSRGEMLGKTSYDLFPKAEADVITARDDLLLQSDTPVADERKICTPRNGVREILARKFMIHDHDGKPKYLVGLIHDMTERKLAEKRIAHLAYHDALTGLPNRLSLHEHLADLLTQDGPSKPNAVVLFDLDGFKDINDTSGHAAGDKLLIEVGRRLIGVANDRDAVGQVCRLGGDEFVIVIAGCGDPRVIAEIAETVLKRIADPFSIENKSFHLAASAGIAIAPGDGTTVDELITNADLALYQAKSDGGRAYRFFVPVLRAQAQARHSLDLELRRAFAENEFEIYFQPQVRLSDEAVAGAEALLRWRHPVRGILAPGVFMEALETSTFVAELGGWILRTACQKVAAWRSQGLPVDRIGVNLFPSQFLSDRLLKDIEDVLRATDLPAEVLELELTENVALNHEGAILSLQKLNQKGVHLALDDFGTGYASLSSLAQLPVSRIKIDRSFVRKVTESSEDAAIARSLIAMAHNLGLSVIAEGIETKAQAKFLEKEGCEEAQGFFYAKPMPAGEFESYLMARCLAAPPEPAAGKPLSRRHSIRGGVATSINRRTRTRS